MNRNDAIAFLKAHQPMPPEPEVPLNFMEDRQKLREIEEYERLLAQYEEVRQYFIAHPDPEIIPLFLNSFGSGTGFGIYQVVVEALEKYSPQEMAPHLRHALTNASDDIRSWAIEIAAHFPTTELLEPVKQILLDDLDDNMRFSAVAALGVIDDERVLDILAQALKKEMDAEVRQQIEIFSMDAQVNKILTTLAPFWRKEPGATYEQIRQAETDFHVRFPKDYWQLMLWSNGGEGQIGPVKLDEYGDQADNNLYLALWSVQDLKQVNEGYNVAKYLPGVVFVGTDTGPTFFAFDFRKGAEPPFISVPVGAFGDDDIIVLGRSISETLQQALSD